MEDKLDYYEKSPTAKGYLIIAVIALIIVLILSHIMDESSSKNGVQFISKYIYDNTYCSIQGGKISNTDLRWKIYQNVFTGEKYFTTYSRQYKGSGISSFDIQKITETEDLDYMNRKENENERIEK